MISPRMYIHTYLFFARSCLAFISPGDDTIFDSDFSDRINTAPMEACCCVSHYVRRFSCIVSRPYRDRLPLRYIHFTTYFTTRRSSKYPGLSQPNTQRSGMRRHKTLPHIIHCCHVATLSSSSAKHSVPDILGQLLLVTLCKKVT